jgi:kynurenine 3-monooxygenase
MVPFYGQGMNTGLESVRVLFAILDKYGVGILQNEGSPPLSESVALQAQALALEEYSRQRVPDVHAVIDLALQNYLEMRSSVLSPTYRLRKFLEEMVSVYFPRSGWRTKYSRVSFGNERFTDVVKKSEYQGRILTRGFAAIISSPILIAGIVGYIRYGRRFPTIGGGLLASIYRCELLFSQLVRTLVSGRQ